MKMGGIIRRTATAIALGCALAAANAKPVQVTSDKTGYNVGDVAVFTVSDGNPRDMLGCGVDELTCLAADFLASFDPALFAFDSIAYPGWVDPALMPSAGVSIAGEVSVSLAAFFDDLAAMQSAIPTAASDLFYLHLTAIKVGPSSITIQPLPPLGCTPADCPPAYSFAEGTARVDITAPVPEPASLALVATGLGLAALMRRRRHPAA